jgi:Uma2 family endonuclease
MSVVVNGKTLLTYSDYVLFPDDGRRHEIIGGVHHVTPSPVTKHQRVSRWTQFQLFEQIEIPGLGQVIDAPMDLVLSQTDVVQPDIMVILAQNRGIVSPRHVRGAPDLVIEITSPTTQENDLVLKKSLYQTHGVPEYWVMLTEEDLVEKYVLEGSENRLSGRHHDRIEFSGLQGVAVDLTRVWA